MGGGGDVGSAPPIAVIGGISLSLSQDRHRRRSPSPRPSPIIASLGEEVLVPYLPLLSPPPPDPLHKPPAANLPTALSITTALPTTGCSHPSARLPHTVVIVAAVEERNEQGTTSVRIIEGRSEESYPNMSLPLLPRREE